MKQKTRNTKKPSHLSSHVSDFQPKADPSSGGRFRASDFVLISGGQTGADRAALDFAIAHKIPHGGWCPKGRQEEDGILSKKYHLIETSSDNYEQRTKKNVRESDGTVIFGMSKKMMGGTLFTFEYVQNKNKPCLCLLGISVETAARRLDQFIKAHHVRVLNVAGPRASREQKVYAFVMKVLKKCPFWGSESHATQKED